MIKVTIPQKNILQRLIFPESFSTIMEETGMRYGEIRDDIMQLLHLGLIKAVGLNPQDVKKMVFYDLDNVNSCLFQATPRGLKVIKQVIAEP